ncbi:2,4-dienoyl-CoA reductase-like NADH-dependent reductase (Old Yellow Enzyme family) [Panacagrimonas perspica]|uniref:2,4-dienoyl-CoA reductase-like NADH-dependent reductase (Old Yellow Enzyme family) n=1 Tax=Panacagrimonas perspica TaxID=381431 RepID=A0A4V6Q482_9GAMM|nr:NADH:flavin oxidoreductase [Panacagrimonas perspica]TDU26496.1 2,4-dienoyl-CoA reductase-like NADH-dependent reductase (Old Yellow Enzyme family) [Panacagrimonas perspica]
MISEKETVTMTKPSKWKELSSPITMRGVTFKNRMMRSGMYEGMATERGMVTADLESWIARQAAGGAGCIFPGYSNVALPRCMPFQTGSYSDSHIPGLKKLADIIHSYGAVAGLQLAAAGRQANPNLFFSDAEAVMGPSAMGPSPMYAAACREMTEAEIWKAIEDTAAAAVRAKKAGFDVVLPNAAHGYLLAQFLSPHTNKRTDAWGGSPEKRFKFFDEVFRAVRKAVGPDMLVWTKISVDEPWDDGINLDEARIFIPEVAKLVDAIEISGGTIVDNVFMMTRGEIPIGTLKKGIGSSVGGISAGLIDALYGMRDSVKFEEAYWYKHAVALKPLCGDTPLILTGGHKYPATMNQIVKEGTADMLSLARVLAAEPNFPNEVLEGREDPGKCSNCNKCLVEVVLGNKLRCFLPDPGYSFN